MPSKPNKTHCNTNMYMYYIAIFQLPQTGGVAWNHWAILNLR